MCAERYGKEVEEKEVIGSMILWVALKKFYRQSIHTFWFISERSLLHKISEVLFIGIALSPPWLLEDIVVLCFERRYPNKIVLTVWPPNFWAGYATGFIETLLRAAQKVFGSPMPLSEVVFIC